MCVMFGYNFIDLGVFYTILFTHTRTCTIYSHIRANIRRIRFIRLYLYIFFKVFSSFLVNSALNISRWRTVDFLVFYFSFFFRARTKSNNNFLVIYLVFLALATLAPLTCLAWFVGCDYKIDLKIGYTQTITSYGYPTYGYPVNSSCRYLIKAPGDYQVQANCYIDFVGTVRNRGAFKKIRIMLKKNKSAGRSLCKWAILRWIRW